jgi:hypothetical protein
MSKTTEWFLELQENGLVSIYQTVVEDIDHEEVTEEVLTLKTAEDVN